MKRYPGVGLSVVLLLGVAPVGCTRSDEIASAVRAIRAATPDTVPLWECNAEPVPGVTPTASSVRQVSLVSRVDVAWSGSDVRTVLYQAMVWSPGEARDTAGGYTSHVAAFRPRVDTIHVRFTRSGEDGWVRQCPASMPAYLPFGDLADAGFYYNRDEFELMKRWVDSTRPDANSGR